MRELLYRWRSVSCDEAARAAGLGLVALLACGDSDGGESEAEAEAESEGECADKCNSPPQAECLDTDTLRTYEAPGTCMAETDTCTYDAADSPCDLGCIAAACRVDTWTAMPASGAPSARRTHTMTWTGSEALVWGGDFEGSPLNDGARFDPANTKTPWQAMPLLAAPGARQLHTAVWTDSELIVWGGYDYIGGLADGGRFDPADSTGPWTATSFVDPPEARALHVAVWTGSEMVVWGGWDGGGGGGVGNLLDTGGRYDPSLNVWIPTPTSGAPTAVESTSAVWTGSEMIVWGGSDGGNSLSSGGRYDPVSDTWSGVTMIDAPLPRSHHEAVWTGSEMIVWGGVDSADPVEDGGRYDPVANSWTATAADNAPPRRYDYTAIWTGYEMIVWGGRIGGGEYTNTGGRYDPATDTWMATSNMNPPAASAHHAAVWTGSEMLVWGGEDGDNELDSGGRYTP